MCLCLGQSNSHDRIFSKPRQTFWVTAIYFGKSHFINKGKTPFKPQIKEDQMLSMENYSTINAFHANYTMNNYQNEFKYILCKGINFVLFI